MNSVAALRTASIIALLQWAAHTALFLRARPTHGAAEIAVVETMKSHRFNFSGAIRSYWDMYFGYGLIAAIIVLVEALLFWNLAGAASIPDAQPLIFFIAVLFLAFNVGHALLAARYFFLVPIVPDVLIAICLGVAAVQLRR